MPNINDALRKRKQHKKQQVMNKISKAKRSFNDQKKYIEKDNLEKLKSDKLADKKMDFYNSLFDTANDNNQEEEHTTNENNKHNKKLKKGIEKVNNKQGYKREKFNREEFKKQIKEQKEKKKEEIEKIKKQKEQERKKVKKIFTERTKTGQPVMKNYINYLVDKLEKEKKQTK